MAKECKTEKTSSPCNCLNIRRAALSMTKLYDDYLAPSGLTVSQYSVLRHLKALGSVSVSTLAEKLRLDRTTLVRNLSPLEEEGYVADVSVPGSRGRALELTQKGTVKLTEAAQLWNDAQRHVEDTLGTENIQQLTSLLQRVENLR